MKNSTIAPMLAFSMEGVVACLVFIVDFFVILDVFASDMSRFRKAVWTVIILIAPVLGMLVYFATKEPRNDA